MATSIRATTNKRGRPKTTGKGTPIQVRVQADILAALDEFRAKSEGNMSRPEAVRALVRDALIGAGHLEPRSSAAILGRKG
jgi:metal-responsive CopG/Arc/MetJ family transcriptional regulator